MTVSDNSIDNIEFTFRAAECCLEACSFFGFLQQLCNYFTASTHRWEILLSKICSDSLTLKSLSKTRWSARNDACRSLSNSWSEVCNALSSVEDDTSEMTSTRQEASTLHEQMASLDTAFMSVCEHSCLDVSRQLGIHHRQ